MYAVSTNDDTEYTTARITKETQEVLRKISGLTGETADSIILRLSSNELNELISNATPKFVREKRVKYSVRRNK